MACNKRYRFVNENVRPTRTCKQHVYKLVMPPAGAPLRMERQALDTVALGLKLGQHGI